MVHFQALSRVDWSQSALAEFHYLLGDLHALPKTPEKTEMGFAFSARFCLILTVSVSKNRDPRYQLKPRME